MSLKSTLDEGDRRNSGNAAKKLAESVKDVRDNDIKKKSGQLRKAVTAEAGNIPSQVFSGENIMPAVAICIAFLLLSVIAIYLTGEKAVSIIRAFSALFLLAWAAQVIAGNYTIQYFGIEYVFWCLFLGLLVSNVAVVPEWLKPVVRTEFTLR